MTSQLKQSTYLFGSNSAFIEKIYERYLENPDAVDESWKQFFAEVGDDALSVSIENRGASWAPKQTAIVGYFEKEDIPVQAANVSEDRSSSLRAHMLIEAYRTNGHFLASLDPLGIEKPLPLPELDPAFYGFTEEDLDKPLYIDYDPVGGEETTLRGLISVLRGIYSSHIGLEYTHIQSQQERMWIQEKMEESLGKPSFSAEEKKKIFEDILEVEGFEQFLHVKFPGAKRFSVEGGDSSIAAVEVIIEMAAKLGVKQAVLGMPHRGRLNVLTKVMGKSYAAMLSEFQGELAHPEDMDISGDVKYHLGTSSDRKFGDNEIHLSLTANPSHLEAVNPVVSGKVRAKQDYMGDESRSEVMGLLLHGDSAFAGQGVVAETLALSDLTGYTTGGTVHVIVNNQIGFTTSPKSSRNSLYPTEVAKIVQAPIFHVNGDDPEAVVHACKIATEYRQLFKKDVVLDVICYRKYGHNEGDEPFFTQPEMYTKIRDHQTPTKVYGDRLIAEGVITQDDYKAMVAKFKAGLEEAFEVAKAYKPVEADWLRGQWEGLENPERGIKKDVDTGISKKDIQKIGKSLTTYPEGFNLHSKLARQLEAKGAMFSSGEGFDWATAEALAFSSLLTEGHRIRFTGQDSRRGTFSQRHAVFIDQKNESEYEPMNNIEDGQAKLEIIDSNLSEYAVLGFEYGYSCSDPNSLTLWEAQFGDFVNGAQIMIDQFISSSESKWLRMSGLVMLLPHGYEGQGPEHSSARLERFLQLCAEDNIQVANCTTPANYYHILRRQMHRPFRKPLIIMTPKSLLRHKLVVSSVKEFEKGTSFQQVLPEAEKLVADNKIRKVVLCSGKVYYDLLEARTAKKIKDVALVRVEQYYPFPKDLLIKELKRYKNADVIWCQEEPKNMGAWDFINLRLEEVLAGVKGKSNRPEYVGRDASASPAAGYMKIFKKKQEDLVNKALS